MSKKSFPIDKKTGQEIKNLQQPGYYPGYSTLGQQGAWDSTTRHVVLDRVASHTPVRFFTQQELDILTAVVDRVMPQDDRAPDRTIPIVPSIDDKLYKNQLDGYRFETMPPDREAYRMGIRAINEMAQERYFRGFTELSIHQQELILRSIHDGKPDPDHPVWHDMPPHRFWAKLMEDTVTVYYAHPWVWDEIGFGGPAYPRAYMRLENGEPEPWEVNEKRYEWNAPEDSVSELDKDAAPPPHTSTHGSGGTH
jgi:hypothetical protein